MTVMISGSNSLHILHRKDLFSCKVVGPLAETAGRVLGDVLNQQNPLLSILLQLPLLQD